MCRDSVPTPLGFSVPMIEAGNVYLPHPLYAPWVNDFIEECVAFPNGAHDDQVDAMTQALRRWNMIPRTPVYALEPIPEISPIWVTARRTTTPPHLRYAPVGMFQAGCTLTESSA